MIQAGFLTENEGAGGPCSLHSQPEHQPILPTCWARPRACFTEGPVLALGFLLPPTGEILDSLDGTQICNAGEGPWLGEGFPWDRRSHNTGSGSFWKAQLYRRLHSWVVQKAARTGSWSTGSCRS